VHVEQGWNPFYAHLLAHLCSIDKHHQFTLRLCFWDAFKEMETLSATAAGKTKIANIAQLLAHAWAKSALSLSLLKPIEIEQMGEGGHLCLKLAFRSLLLQCGENTLKKLVEKISGRYARPRVRVALSCSVMLVERAPSLTYECEQC
jgi:hypothetical protein